VRFTRRDIRPLCGVTDTALRLHLERLVELEYLLVHRGGFGSRFVYELAYDGDAASADAHLIGLLDVDALRQAQTSHPKTPTSQGAKANLAPRSHPENTPLAPTSHAEETPRNAHAGAGISSLVAAFEDTAVPRSTRAPRRNGAVVAAG
jgi:DNA primase